MQGGRFPAALQPAPWRLADCRKGDRMALTAQREPAVRFAGVRLQQLFAGVAVIRLIYALCSGPSGKINGERLMRCIEKWQIEVVCSR